MASIVDSEDNHPEVIDSEDNHPEVCEKEPISATSTEAVAATDREAILRSRIAELKHEVTERQRRNGELQAAIAQFPSREDTEAAAAELQQKLDTTRDELQSVVAQLDVLRPQEEEAFQLCARLHRLESYCSHAEQWAENVLRTNVEEDIAKETSAAEAEIAAFVEELQSRRDDALSKLSALRERIRTRAADLRRGYNREPVKSKDPAMFSAPSNVATLRGVERSVSPRAQEFEEIDDETYEISLINDQLGDEVSQLHDRLKRLHKLRSKYHSELMHFKQDAKKEIATAENNVRQIERSIGRDQRVIQQLHATNGALISTLQMVMAQLNVEHYGTQIGPAAIDQASRRQEAITERQSARSGSSMVPRITDRSGNQK